MPKESANTNTKPYPLPSKIPIRMNYSRKVKISPKCSSFPPVNLFSVPALLSHTSLSDQAGYIFTFLHEGRRQQAVLEKTFLTGLEKDNVKISWEEARRELMLGCDLRIDVTQVKTSSIKEDWLVFGLYFSRINTHFSQFQEVLLNSSKGKFLKYARLPFLEMNEENSLNNARPSIKSCFWLGTEEALWGEIDDGLVLGKVVKKCQTSSRLLPLSTSQTLQEKSVAKIIVDYRKSVNDDGFIGDDNFDCMKLSAIRTNLQADNLLNSIKEDDISGLVLEDSLDKAQLVSFTSVRDSLDTNVGFSNLTDDAMYFESLFLRSSSLRSDADSDAQFENVMAANGLLENYNDFEAEFDLIFKETFSSRSEANLMQHPSVPNICCNTQLAAEPDRHPVSSHVLETPKVREMFQSPVETSDNSVSDWDLSFVLGPSLTSTPSKNCSEEDCSSCPLSGSISDGNFIPVKMDSGFYESFASASTKRTSLESTGHPKHANNNLDNLLDFWRKKENLPV